MGVIPHRRMEVLSAVLVFLGAAAYANAEQPFAQLVGPVEVRPVGKPTQVSMPFILWGGDFSTFYANGGVETKPGSIFHKQGLNIKLTRGDDFIQQVRDYLSGKSPFLRGTFRMVGGLASEVIGANPDSRGRTVLQMTWSAGDHLVVKPHIKSFSDIKRIAVQRGGPHVGLVDDILKTAQLSWDAVEIVWVDDITGPKGPAEAFRRDTSIDACCVVTPDMIGLTGGLQNVGSGAEGTVKGARVLNSTAWMSYAIADIYVCREDFYQANKEWVKKFVAGYLKACEEVVKMKKQYEQTGSSEYEALLRLAQDIFGRDVLPTLEEDAHGLLSDCAFVGYPGNVAFFTEKGNLHGFRAFTTSSLDLAISRGYAKKRYELLPPDFDYKDPVFTSYLSETKVARGDRFRGEAVMEEIEALSSGDLLDDRTIVSFTINFEANQTDFSANQYAKEYRRVVETLGKYGNAVIAIRGHADPTLALHEVVTAGMQKGVIKRSGSKGNWRYFLDGKPLDLSSTTQITQLIQSGVFDGVEDHNPREVVQAALNLSRKRAEEVRNSLVAFAQSEGLQLDATQIQPVGVGIREPLIPKPQNSREAQENMRVEFRLLRVEAESTSASDFDF